VKPRALAPSLLLLGLISLATGGPLTDRDPNEEHRARRLALAVGMVEGTLVLTGAPAGDYRDRIPEPNLFYLTGLTDADTTLVLTVSKPPADESGRSKPPTLLERLYLPPASPRRERWEGPFLHPGPAAAKATGIDDTRPKGVLIEDLLKLPEGSRLYLLDPRNPPRALAPLLRHRPDLDLLPARSLLAPLRSVKSEGEVARIRKACELTAEGLRACYAQCRPGMFEYELQALLEFHCRRGGAPRQAFASIVASGLNGTVLHYQANRRRIEDGDLVLMDVGAEHLGYAADVTRTFPANGRFTDEQARIYDVVLAAQKAAIDRVKPGVTLRTIHLAADAVIEEAGLSSGRMHATSHHVGLEAHDPSRGGPLAKGMVITVEPGLYFPEQGLGIRIEDTVVVTEEGCDVLSAGVPKTRAEIEALMAVGNAARAPGK
jgi:Xaa-Pro aminopeptidase